LQDKGLLAVLKGAGPAPMTMPRVVAISQHSQQRAIQKVADLFTGFSRSPAVVAAGTKRSL
jgi:hypothetical protein